MSSQIYYHPSITKKQKILYTGMDLEKMFSVTVIFLFSPAEMTLSESFVNHSVQFYDALPTRLLETSEENTDMINSWVANKTNNKIQRLVNSVSPSTQLMLLNAVSFKGQWRWLNMCVFEPIKVVKVHSFYLCVHQVSGRSSWIRIPGNNFSQNLMVIWCRCRFFITPTTHWPWRLTLT